MSENQNKYVSDELYHFVGFSHPEDHETNYETLLKIIDSKCVSHPPHDGYSQEIRITLNWDAKIEEGELVVPEVICFCDIPYEALGIHMAKYGRFGLSFRRRFLVTWGVRPVTYVPIQPDSFTVGPASVYSIFIIPEWQAIWQGFYEHVRAPIKQTSWTHTLAEKPVSANDAIIAAHDLMARHFFGFLKAFNADLVEDSSENFYMEREWRKINNLPFEIGNVASVVVPESYKVRLQNDRPDYSDKIKTI